MGAFRASEYVAPGSSARDDRPRTLATTAAACVEAGVIEPVELLVEVPWTWSSNRYGDSALAWRESGPGSLRIGLGATLPRLVRPGGGLALAPGAGLQAEIGASAVLVARQDAHGAGFTMGISHVRGRQGRSRGSRSRSVRPARR